MNLFSFFRFRIILNFPDRFRIRKTFDKTIFWLEGTLRIACFLSRSLISLRRASLFSGERGRAEMVLSCANDSR